MKITVLGSGTSSGVPVPTCQCEVCRSTDSRDHRLRASIYVETGDKAILVDCGPDFRQQALRHNILHIDAVLLTHIHFDHSAGIDDLRIYSYVHALPLYAESYVAAILRQKYDYVFQRPYPGAPHIELQEFVPAAESATVDPSASSTTTTQPNAFLPFAIGGTTVIPIRLMHGELPIVGFRIGKLAYLTDCTSIVDSEWSKLIDIDTLIVDALRWEPHRTHFDVNGALSVVARIRPRATYFTHMSHDIGLHADASRRLPDGVHFAFDGLVIDVPD